MSMSRSGSILCENLHLTLDMVFEEMCYQSLTPLHRAEAVGGEALVAVMEIEEWGAKCFEKEEVFTICGI